MNNKATISKIISEAYANTTLAKIRLTGLKESAEKQLKEIVIRPVKIKEDVYLQFVFRYLTNDVTKNYNLSKAIEIVEEKLANDFYFISVVTRDTIHQLDQKKNRLVKSTNTNSQKVKLNHNKEKKSLISKAAKFLTQIGITSKAGHLLKGKEAKFRQINKFIELLAPHLPNDKSKSAYSVIDMGCGKGYLTFALYDYLANTLKHAVDMKGIDLREELMSACNLISNESKFSGLTFEPGSIDDYIGEMDILIALHACDTATDDVIIKGILAEAKLIVCSPCCHKQVRKAMSPPIEISGITGYGILLERQAEILTDSIRTLMLNHYGYKTKIVEFISGEHTPKNLLIIAEKKSKISQGNKFLNSIENLKSIFGLKEHYIERILTKTQEL